MVPGGRAHDRPHVLHVLLVLELMGGNVVIMTLLCPGPCGTMRDWNYGKAQYIIALGNGFSKVDIDLRVCKFSSWNC